MPEIALPQTGGCQCGAVRYEFTEQPVCLYRCHCTECQKQSGSAFAMSLKVPENAFQWTGAAPRVWERPTDTGKTSQAHFCGTCGTRLVHRTPGNALISIKPGTLDDRSWLKPVGHLWVKSKQAWVEIDVSEPCFDGQPENYDELAAAWRAS